MKTRLQTFLDELDNIKSTLSILNLHKLDGWYDITKNEEFDTIKLELTPRHHDYIRNGDIESFERTIKENESLSWHTYHIGVTTIIIETNKGHMITALAPQITFNFYCHERDI